MITRSEIYLVDFGDPIGHEPGYRRPAIVITQPSINEFGTVVVVPVTSSRRGYATHIEIESLPLTSYAQCELIGVVSELRLVKKIGQASITEMAQIDRTLRRILAL